MSTPPKNEPSRTRAAISGNACGCLLALGLAVSSLLAQGPGGPHGPGGPRMGGPGMGFPGGMGGSNGPGMGRTGANGNAPFGAPTGTRPQGPGGRWWDENKNARSVGLTTDQQRRMDTIFQENRNSLVNGLDNLRKAQARLDALSAADHPNESAVLTEIQNVAQARADLAKSNAHLQLQLRNELTNEQINKLEKLK